MVKLTSFIVVSSVLLLFLVSCQNPATSSELPPETPKDWATASIIDKLTTDDGAMNDFYGYSVAISGDTAIVGAFYDDDKGSDSGSVYIYQRDAGVWTQAQKLTAADGYDDDIFGRSVAISGDTAIVGASLDDDNGDGSGSVYIFRRDTFNGIWYQAHKLTDDDGAAGDEFGCSVAIFGDTVIVGAHGVDDNGDGSGSVYIFQRDTFNGIWYQAHELTADDGAAGDRFGSSVAISGDTAIVGAFNDDDMGTDSGSVYIFQRDAGVWTQAMKLTASDGASWDVFGSSVAISGDTAIVGAFNDDDKGDTSGSVYIFQRDTGVWTQAIKLTASDGAAGDRFGSSVAISGNTTAVGAYLNDDNGSQSGSVYIFQRDTFNGIWYQAQKLTDNDGADNDSFGYSVAISGDTAFVGAFRDDDEGNDSGSVYIIE